MLPTAIETRIDADQILAQSAHRISNARKCIAFWRSAEGHEKLVAMALFCRRDGERRGVPFPSEAEYIATRLPDLISEQEALIAVEQPYVDAARRVIAELDAADLKVAA